MSSTPISHVGAPWSDTLFGPPDRMIPAGDWSRIFCTGVSGGHTSEYTDNSRRRRAMSCVYWDPKSRTIMVWWAKAGGAVIIAVLTTRCCSAVALIALSVVSVAGSEKVDLTPLGLFPTRQIWTLALNSQITVPPAYDLEHVFFGIDGDRLVAYTLAEGIQRWPVEAQPLKHP